MTAPRDLSGTHFGLLTPRIYHPGTKKSFRRHGLWGCDCACGNHTLVTADSLLRGLSRSCGCSRRRGRTIDETRFATVSTPDEAYWLGMLATDGCVGDKSNPSVKLALKSSDIDHVKAFARFMGCQIEPRVESRSKSGYGGGGYVRFAFRSRPVCEALTRNGVGPRKTWSLRPWSGPEDLLPHYWRGCIDGDGSVQLQHTERGTRWQSRVHFCGNSHMVLGFRDYIATRLGFKGSYYESLPRGAEALAAGHRIGRLNFDNAYRCRKILTLLGYPDPHHIALVRKRELALCIINSPVHQPLRDVSDDELVSKYHELGTWAKVSKHYGVTTSGMCSRLDIAKQPITIGRRKPVIKDVKDVV